MLFAIAMWFSSVALANLRNPSEKFSLYCWLAALCFLGSFYAFNKRITLHHGMIEEACTSVFRARYYLTTLESLEVEGNGQYLVIHFAHGRKVTIPRQSRGLSVAGPSKGPTRDGQKRFLRLLQRAIRELDAP